MEFQEEIVWSNRTYAISDLISNENSQSKRSLPVLVKITRGFYGIKEEDTVDIDQMLVFNGSGEETCVCARNEDGCCLSIPVNHQHRFQRLTSTGAPRDANKETQTLQDILEKVRMPTKVRFDETMYTSFTVADKLRNTEEFGALTLVSTHAIEYLQASPVYEGEIHYDHIMFIPNYRDVRFVIAEGPQPFLKSFLDFKNKRRQSHSGQTLSIIGYDDIELSDEEYEVVVPGKLMKPTRNKKSSEGDSLPTENYETVTPMMLSKPQNLGKTGGGKGPQGHRYSEEDFDLIVHGKAAKTQEANKKGGGQNVDTPKTCKPENGASSAIRDSAIQQRFSRDYEGFKPYKQRGTDEDIQDEERDVFSNVNTNPNKGKHPMLRSNSSVTEQARLLEKSLQVIAGGRAGGGKHIRSTLAIPQNAPQPKGGAPKRSSSLSNSPPTHWREPLPLPNLSAPPPRSVPQFSRPAPGGSSNRCSTSSNSSSGSNAGVGGSPRGESPCLNPIGITGATGSPRSESPSLSHIGSAGVPVGGSSRGGSPCLSPLSGSGLGENHGEESPYLSPISLRKGSMCLTTLEDVPVDLSVLSVGDICDCLQLLHMDTHIARFQEDQVDGALLAECSTDDLKDMGLSPLHAKKLAMFAKGWRPKV